MKRNMTILAILLIAIITSTSCNNCKTQSMSTKNEKSSEQDEKLNLRIERHFDVPAQVIFDAFTDPKAMMAWWTDQTTFDMDLRVGGQYTITRKQGVETFVMTGKYLEVEQPRRIRYTISMPQFSPNSDIVTIDITPDGKGGSKVVFVQSGVDITAELKDLPAGTVSESEKGWQQGFDLMEVAWKK